MKTVMIFHLILSEQVLERIERAKEGAEKCLLFQHFHDYIKVNRCISGNNPGAASFFPKSKG